MHYKLFRFLWIHISSQLSPLHPSGGNFISNSHIKITVCSIFGHFILLLSNLLLSKYINKQADSEDKLREMRPWKSCEFASSWTLLSCHINQDEVTYSALPFCLSPLVNEDELAVDGVPGDVLCRLHPDVCQAGLGDDVGVQAADGHQAAQVAALVVGFIVFVETHLGRWPALQVACAVDSAEALTVRCNKSEETRERGIKIRNKQGHLSGIPSPCCGVWWSIFYSSLNWMWWGFIFDYEPTSEQFGWLIQNLLQNAEEATAVMQLQLIIKYKSKH